VDDEALMNYLGLLIDAGCKMRYRGELCGKPYVWMTDQHGNWFAERIPDGS
jgi:hypothetical protein